VSAIEFSRRTRWDFVANRWTALRAEKEARGEPLLDLTASNPTRVGLPYPEDKIAAALGDARALAYEPAPFGLPDARHAVAEHLAAGGAAIPADRIVLAASTSEAYAWLFKLLADPGDAILVPRPGYPLFEFLGGLESVRPVPYPLDLEDAWRIDAEALGRKATPGARALVLVNPNNPTGSFLKRDEWGPLQLLCRARGWAVVSDEVFRDYAYAPDPARVSCAADGAEVLTFSLGGLSKSAGLPQLKLAWIAVGGPDAEVRGALRRLEVIADSYLSVGAAAQWGLRGLLAAGAEVRARIQARAASNRAALESACAGSACRPLPAEGGWYGILQIPATRPEEEWVLRLLAEDGVAVHPGYFYDFPREAFLVLSLLPPEPSFAAAAAAIVRRVAAEA